MSEPKLTGDLFKKVARGACLRMAATVKVEDLFGDMTSPVTLSAADAYALYAVAAEALGIRKSLAEISEDDAIATLQEFRHRDEQRALLQHLKAG